MEKGNIIHTAQELIRIPSENPPGNEEACAEYVERFFSDAGIKTVKKYVEDKRPNILAKLRGYSNKPLVILAHMDTVPAGENWGVDPFAAEIRGKKLYGRGAADMKGGLSIAMHLISEISKMKLKLKRDLLVCITIDEEGPLMKGIVNLIEEGAMPKEAFVLALEPTDLKLAIATKGVMWYEVTIMGKPAHAANAWEGVDAISGMLSAMHSLGKYVEDLGYNDPVLGKSQILVGKIVGGEQVNIVPSLCKAEVDFRFVPPLDCAGVQELINRAIKDACSNVKGLDGCVKNLGLERPPFYARSHSLLVHLLEDSFLQIMGRQLEKFGIWGYTDAAIVGVRNNNLNCLIFGPGNIAQAHSVDEFISVDDLATCYEILLRTMVSLLTREDESDLCK
jgi:succinyl-diaminopimelate desuccinylase